MHSGCYSVDRVFHVFVGALVCLSTAFATHAEDGISSTSTGLQLMSVPAGTFRIGSAQSEKELASLFAKWYSGSFRYQFPTREVQLTRSFYIGKFEITQQQFQKVMGFNPSFFPQTGAKAEQYPVERVSWYDSVAFCNRLSERDGFSPCYEIEGLKMVKDSIDVAKVKRLQGTGYRLPTEAEWEYACRAGTTTVWSTGDSLESLNAAGWWGGYPSVGPRGNSDSGTQPIGRLKPNKFGLYDMHGNVAEWCQDTGRRSYNWGEKEKPLVDPCFEDRNSDSRIHRGGSALDSPYRTTSAFRGDDSIGDRGRSSTCGFRIVRNAVEPLK